MDKNLQKALEAYTGAFLIKIIWGNIPKQEMPKYRLRIMNRKSGKIKYSSLEKEKLYKFLANQAIYITDCLNNADFDTKDKIAVHLIPDLKTMTEEEAFNDPEIKTITLLSEYVRELREGADYETTTYKLAETLLEVFSISNFSKKSTILLIRFYTFLDKMKVINKSKRNGNSMIKHIKLFKKTDDFVELSER